MTIAKKIASPLFHATTESYERPQAGSDLVFWTTESSAIAQAYLPSNSGSLHTRHIFSSEMNDPVTPNRADPLYAVVQQMGFEAVDVTTDRNGIAQKWTAPPGYPTYGMLVEHIEKVMGYCSVHPTIKSYFLQCIDYDVRRHQDTIAPSGYKKPGTLWIVKGHEKMRLFDTMAPGHAHAHPSEKSALSIFERLITLGYDGVIIPDHLHSATRGEVSHRSIGFFQKAIDSLVLDAIPATHFEWDAGSSELDSPEYKARTRAHNALELARRASEVVYEKYDLVCASKRLRDGRDTVPVGTRGMVIAVSKDSYLIEFSGEVTMACNSTDLNLREKNDKLQIPRAA